MWHIRSTAVPGIQLLHRNMQRLRGGLVFKAHRLCVSLNSGLESNKEEGAPIEKLFEEAVVDLIARARPRRCCL